MLSTSGRRRRLIAAGLAAATVLAGLAVRFALPRGALSDVAGDALYAVLVYLGLVVVVPRARPALVAAVAGSLCVVIELFQLTGLPRAWASVFGPIALVLGTGFDARDLVVYLAAVTVAAIVDAAATRLRPGRRPRHARPGSSRSART